jgi:orotidine-5'-phosphate decarboxylase
MDQSLACCGLDPNIQEIDRIGANSNTNPEVNILNFIEKVIEITHIHVCAYKIQKACFDMYPNGHKMLAQTVSMIKATHPNIPVFIDAKIGDIENTMKFYLFNIFEKIGADGVVINPYMGQEVFDAFKAYPEKVGIVLVKTSNSGADPVQNLLLHNGNLLWEEILEFTLGQNKQFIPVLSRIKNLKNKPSLEDTPILFAGVGAQGGELEGLQYLLNKKRSGVFVNSSRNILYAEGNDHWTKNTYNAVVKLKESINEIRRL